jgi:hypothetical protein
MLNTPSRAFRRAVRGEPVTRKISAQVNSAIAVLAVTMLTKGKPWHRLEHFDICGLDLYSDASLPASPSGMMAVRLHEPENVGTCRIGKVKHVPNGRHTPSPRYATACHRLDQSARRGHLAH